MWPRATKQAYDRLRGVDEDSQAGLATPPGGHLEASKQEEDSFELPDGRAWPSRVQQARQVTMAVAALLCLWVVAVTAWRTTLRPWPAAVWRARQETQTLTCGNTTAEAVARGCAFDLLSHNWVAPACLDPLTESEYRAYISSPERTMGPYPYFLDKEGTRRVGDEAAFAALANGPTLADQHVFTTREEHLAHCEFLLRRTHRAAERKVRLNDENIQFWHSEHCLGELRHAERKPLTEINEGFYVGFASCTIEVPFVS